MKHLDALRTSRPGADLPRRDFLWRLAGASALALGAVAGGLSLYDPAGPAAVEQAKALPGLGSFVVTPPAGFVSMALVRGDDRRAMFAKAMEALGGMGAYVTAGDTVLVKVNAAFASPAALGATTHPDILAAVLQACRAAGASRILVTDNPINNPAACFEISGLSQAAEQSGARLILPRQELFRPASLPGGRLIRNWPVMAGAFAGVTKLIALAPIKDHSRAGASMILKNFYGLLGGRRNVFHQDINGIIAELALLARPTLAVLDGTVSMLSNGPTGGSLADLKATRTLIVSTDPVAADVAGAELLGRTVADLPYLAAAAKAGAGSLDYQGLHPAVLDSTV